ncbi:MAG TPA: hypothetical protein DIT64_19030 [Verrucomicrobiales bacterium]|nr:hypothetical protein [Verrucomicrobiales bacterium]
MITVLESPEARQTVHPLSVEFYHEAGRLGLIGEDVELLEGVLFKKMPESPLHQSLVRLLQRLLESVIPAACFVDRESPVTCVRSEPEPDLAVFAGAPEDFRHAHPATAELVIEIAINTRQRDLDKAAVCAGAGGKNTGSSSRRREHPRASRSLRRRVMDGGMTLPPATRR